MVLTYLAPVKNTCIRLHCMKIISRDLCYLFFFPPENLSSDSTLSSPSALNSQGMGVEGLNRRRKKRTSIETNIRVALEKSFLEVSNPVALSAYKGAKKLCLTIISVRVNPLLCYLGKYSY